MPRINALPPQNSPAGEDMFPADDASDSNNTKKVTLTKLKEWFQGLTGWISTAMLAAGAVTADKLGLGLDTHNIATSQTTTSTSYTDLATVGPTVTVVVPASGKVFVSYSAFIAMSVAAIRGNMALALSGANTVAAGSATGDNKIEIRPVGTNAESQVSVGILTGLTPGSTTFTLKYQVQSGTGTFSLRSLTVIPVG